MVASTDVAHQAATSSDAAAAGSLWWQEGSQYCKGFGKDRGLHVTVTPSNARILQFGKDAVTTWQAAVQCAGSAPSGTGSRGRCDDPSLREEWKCRGPIDFGEKSGVQLWYVGKMLHSLRELLSQKPTASILFLGLGAGSIQTTLKQEFPEMQQLTVELNPEVVTVAKDFFGFDGPVKEADGTATLSSLAAEGQHFDAIVVDMSSGLDRKSLRTSKKLLNPDGVILQNVHDEPIHHDVKVDKKVLEEAFKEFFTAVHQDVHKSTHLTSARSASQSKSASTG